MDNKHSTACLHTTDVNPVRTKCGVINSHVCLPLETMYSEVHCTACVNDTEPI